MGISNGLRDSLLIGLCSFQWALTNAGWQPGTEPRKGCTTSSACVVPWAGGTRAVSSVVLIANGLCFAFMTVIFIWLGSAADYGSFGCWLLLGLTVVCWALQYGMMSIRHPSQWPTAMVLYIVAYVCYGATLVFYAAVFPRLARYMPHVRKAREEDLKEGRIDQGEYDAIESLERNHIRYLLRQWRSSILILTATFRPHTATSAIYSPWSSI